MRGNKLSKEEVYLVLCFLLTFFILSAFVNNKLSLVFYGLGYIWPIFLTNEFLIIKYQNPKFRFSAFKFIFLIDKIIKKLFMRCQKKIIVTPYLSPFVFCLFLSSIVGEFYSLLFCILGIVQSYFIDKYKNYILDKVFKKSSKL